MPGGTDSRDGAQHVDVKSQGECSGDGAPAVAEGTAATDSRDGGGAVATLEPVRIGADGHSDPFATEARVTAEGAGPVGDTEDPELAVYPDPTSGIKIRHGSDEGRGARIVRRQGRRKRFSMGGEMDV